MSLDKARGQNLEPQIKQSDMRNELENKKVWEDLEKEVNIIARNTISYRIKLKNLGHKESTRGNGIVQYRITTSKVFEISL